MSTLPLTHQHTSSLNVAHMHTCTYAHTQTCKTFDYWQIERIQACPFVQLWDCYVITTNSTIYVYVSLLFQFVTFCSLQDRENAECLVFINFLSQHNLTLTPALDKTLVMGRLWGDRYTFNIRKGDPLHQPSEMACTVLSLSLSYSPFWTSQKGKMRFLQCHFQTLWAGWDFFQHVCLACSIWCQFVSFCL